MTEKSAFKNHTDLVSSSSLVIVSKKSSTLIILLKYLSVI